MTVAIILAAAIIAIAIERSAPGAWQRREQERQQRENARQQWRQQRDAAQASKQAVDRRKARIFTLGHP
jgi:hypothetical protein